MNWLKQNWLLITILLIALFFRLYRIEATMTFLEDEGRDLLIAKRMIDTSRPVLLGPQTSTGNMYLGPLYYYLITPALILFGMNPVGPAVLIALSGVVTVYLLYYLGRKWFSNQAGYLAAILFAVLPFSVAVTRASWNPNLVPLIATLMLVVYDKLVYGRATYRVWFTYGLLVGVMVQLHYMALVYCGVLSLSIAWHLRHKFAKLARGLVPALIGLVMMLLPFIIFEIRNDWVNTHALTRFLLAKEEHNIRYDPPAWLWWDKVSQTSYRLLGNSLIGSQMGAQSSAPYVVSGLIILAFMTALYTWSNKTKVYLSLAMIFLGSMAILGIYQESIHMHYLEFGLPLIILIVAGIFQPKSPKWLKWAMYFLLFIIFIFGTLRTLNYITSGATHQAEKARLVASYIVSRAGNDPYNVVSTQGMYTTPFQYYLAISENPPVNILTKRIFDICAGAPCPLDDETTTLLFLTGPGHPAITAYLGHPELNSFSGKRKIVSNEHVSLGIWVAEIVLE
ncbi:hypothetical protein COU89_00905 [Candidatus Roizmanbacteria bacterium CG10_big_fil_rev_8_21_14_0_10_45_7]|uniref:Glycosyltransferase RgtA/B/C/D-like domain-containing protein n=1 Tax=Candidatus Roizmanbacteria bacterium CG10_big_fil_rev_8_21_14_0_10_45_7 TaxID=1974854 RepID=A0A2M8KVG7_9BACT|nr:MAG: hypothetical protein COU89_00905 [Candidatus Roizmanbacteria bacterium CG10_big_fil_rev_8_21_14_0_10_45_7]